MKNDDCFTGNTSKFNEPSSSRDELQGLCHEVGFSDNPKSDFVPVIIDVLTLFPEIFTPLSSGIMKRARDNGLIELKIHNIRDYTTDKHGKCDDYAFGGGAGMVMTPQPIVDAIRSVDSNHESKRIFLSPRGRQFNQSIVTELAQYQRLLFLCGHYEGVDQRAIDGFIDEEISIGDYVLMGGELPAMVVIEALSRYVPGVLHSEDSTREESFVGSLLEYPQFTRPAVFEGIPVPEVLLSGHHGNVEKWRLSERIKITKERRPDLLKKANLPEEKPKKKREKRHNNENDLNLSSCERDSSSMEIASSLRETQSSLNESKISLNEVANSQNETRNPSDEIEDSPKRD